MTSRDDADGAKQARKAVARQRLVVTLVGAAGAFAAAAAMTTGSTVTAAPAKADIDALLDPIIQPFMTSLSDAIAGFDPAAAADVTSWTDSLLSSLNALDMGAALPAAADPAAAPSGVFDIPLTMREVTEPTVNVAVEGGNSVPMLVDTGSSGLVVPWENVGPFGLGLFSLGLPSNINESGYSGGVDYIYLEYDNATVNYGDGALTTTNTPIDVEIFSWPTAIGAPLSFEQFLADDQVSGILGIGDAASDGGPTVSPLEAVGFNGVTVDVPHGEMVVGANSGTPLATVSGAPITNGTLNEVVTLPGGTPTSSAIYADVDSGGVYGTIPSSLVGNAGSVPSGTVISVYDGNTLLYSYTTGTDSLGNSTAPSVISGIGTARNPLDSGVEPFLQEPIYIDYVHNTLTFDQP